jgi:two-component system sensor histidine kinase/response regulator
LIISKRFVEMMAGQIWAESIPGADSTFHFSAWFEVAQEQSRKPDQKKAAQGLHVLVVDDSADARQIFIEQLEALGLRAEAAGDGEAGLRKLQQSDNSDPFDVVLMDWRMPGLDGVETTRQITTALHLQHQPQVVMVTAFGSDDVRTVGSAAGASYFLDKPVSQSRLWDTLAEIAHPATQVLSLEEVGLDEPGDLLGLRVLLVEDNEINQQIARELMQGMGVDVTVACHGREALDRLLAAPDPLPWDLVLMDLQMPVMDGHQAARALRADKRFDALPVIALTAHASVEEAQRCLADGMNEHITKPIDPDALHACLVRWAKSVGPTELTIAGIDVARGLHLCGGNRPLYKSLLEKFASNTALLPQDIRQAIAEADLQKAQRLAHTVKGVAANLGAQACSEEAAALEAALHEGADMAEVERLIAALDQSMQQLVRGIHEALPPTSAPAPVLLEVDPQLLRRVCRDLSDLLQACSMDAGEMLREHADLLRQGLGSYMEAVQRHTENFDHALALDALNEALVAAHIELI